jgi:hypothetical protein
MEFLSEDATYLAGGLGILAAAFLVALKVTQQGKFLVWALSSLGLAALFLVIEQLWVTDAERIERVVYDLRTAVAASNPQGVFAQLAPDVEYTQQGQSIGGDDTRSFIQSELERVKFDFVRITRLEANAGRQSGRGSAEFRVLASGSYQTSLVTYNFGTTNLDFSLGFRQTSPQVWKVDRITLTRPPREMPTPGGRSSPGGQPRFRLRFPRRPAPAS